MLVTIAAADFVGPSLFYYATLKWPDTAKIHSSAGTGPIILLPIKTVCLSVCFSAETLYRTSYAGLSKFA